MTDFSAEERSIRRLIAHTRAIWPRLAAESEEALGVLLAAKLVYHPNDCGCSECDHLNLRREEGQ